jgi:cation diffusion facilitator family transporter
LSRKERAAIISLVASLVMAAVKLALGLALGSLALITDALHSVVDFVATGMTYLAVRWGDRPPDESHPYGHGKFESLAAMAEATLLLLLAGGVMVEAIRRLAEGAPPPTFTVLVFIVLGVEIAVNSWRASVLRRVGRETGSRALEANSLHFTSDVFSSLAVMAGFVLIGLGYGWGDAAAAVAVALLIAFLALRLLRRTVDDLVDRAPPGLARALEDMIADVSGVVDVQAVRIRPVGPRFFVDATVNVPRSLSVEQAAAVKERVAEAAQTVLGNAEIVVQSNPVALDDETIHERVLLVAARENAAVHHVTVHHAGERLAVALDLEVDAALPLGAAHEQADRLEQAIRTELGAETEVETHIEPLMPVIRSPGEIDAELRGEFEALLRRQAVGIPGLSEIHDVRVRQSPAGYVVVAHCRLDPAEPVRSVHEKVDALERAVREERPEIARILIHAEPRQRARD